VSMDALDKLLVMCHAQALNLFVESYLKMVQKLLERLITSDLMFDFSEI